MGRIDAVFTSAAAAKNANAADGAGGGVFVVAGQPEKGAGKATQTPHRSNAAGFRAQRARFRGPELIDSALERGGSTPAALLIDQLA